MNKDYQQLRKVFEGGDPFVSRGHQIVELRRRKRTVPAWTRSDKEIRKVLLQSFPKLMINQKQRDRAARWARIIHLYFRLQWTSRQVAEELNITASAALTITRSILRAANGLKANGTGARGVRPKGRPKLVP
jgi:Trp operon repressor